MPNIIFEDGQLIVINKTAGLITEVNPFEDSSESKVKTHLKRNSKRQDPYLGVIHRLDRVTSGVLVFAKKKSILKIWNKAFEEKQIQKEYLAVSQNKLPFEKGELKHWHQKDQKNKCALISKTKRKGFKICLLEYELLEASANAYLYLLKPLTGKFHQIRAQMGACDCPILGDVKYGAKPALKNQIALHARELNVSTLSKSFAADVESNVYWNKFEHKLI